MIYEKKVISKLQLEQMEKEIEETLQPLRKASCDANLKKEAAYKKYIAAQKAVEQAIAAEQAALRELRAASHEDELKKIDYFRVTTELYTLLDKKKAETEAKLDPQP